MSDAYEDGVRLLSRRALTRHEVVARLEARGHGAGAIEDAVERLSAQSAIDDRSVARRWIESHAAARGRGRERALAELHARGIDASIASSAWSEAVEDGAIDGTDLVARAVRRRLGPPPGRAGKSRLARVYNALLHEGFERQSLEAALAPYGFERIDP
jgi:regulatory protein